LSAQSDYPSTTQKPYLTINSTLGVFDGLAIPLFHKKDSALQQAQASIKDLLFCSFASND